MSQEPQCARFRSIFTCSPLDSIYITQWLVGCGLTSHSAIFQLYSDGTVVRFPNFDLLPGTQPHGQLGVFSVPSLPRHGHPDVWRRLLPPCYQRAHRQWGCVGNRTRIVWSTVQPVTSMPLWWALHNAFYLVSSLLHINWPGETR